MKANNVVILTLTSRRNNGIPVEIFLHNSVRNGVTTTFFAKPLVTFDNNWDGIFHTQRYVYQEQQITNPGTPVRDGYEFKGWFTDPDVGEELIFPFQVDFTHDMTYYAHWGPASGTTATPTLETPYCRAETVSGGGTVNRLWVSITNMDPNTVTIINGLSEIGTLAGESSGAFMVLDNFTTPYDYNLFISAKALNKDVSATVARTGRVTFCINVGAN